MLPGIGGLFGGGLSASSSATSGATGGVQDTEQSSANAFNFKSDASSGLDNTVILAGLAAVAVVAVVFAIRR